MFKRLLPVLLALTALPAGATTTFYIGATGGAQEIAFNAAAGSLTSLTNFSGYAGVLPNFTLPETTTGITFAGFTNNGTTAANLALNGTKLSQASGAGGTNSTIAFDLPGTVKIVGMHLSASLFGNYCYEAPSTTSCTTNFDLDTTSSFFGIVSNAALPDFQLRLTSGTSGRLLLISDVSVSSGASVSETPEPSTFALIGSGLILFPLLARRKRRQ